MSTVGAALLAVSVFVPLKAEWTEVRDGVYYDTRFVSWNLLDQGVVIAALVVICAITAVAALAVRRIRAVWLLGAVALSVAGYVLWTTYRHAHHANQAWALRREQLVREFGHLRVDGIRLYHDLPEKAVLVGWGAHVLLAGALALIAAAVLRPGRPSTP